jgi:predicted acylesterase/phospholipase RssA
MYKNIVLSGGSSKGYSYIGVLKSLEENNLYDSLENFLGTSVGSIFATFLAMKFKYKELIIYTQKTFILEDINIENLLEHFGVCSGIEIINFVEEVISKKYKTNITFKELNFLRNNNLIICVTDLKKHELKYLSHKNYPDMKIIDAIRFAITLPYIFTLKRTLDDEVFMDGALIENISFYNFKPKETLSVMLMDKNQIDNNIDSLENFTKNILLCLKKNYMNKKLNKNFKIIKICCSNIDTLDFSLNVEKRKYLFKLGYECVNNFLKKIK